MTGPSRGPSGGARDSEAEDEVAPARLGLQRSDVGLAIGVAASAFALFAVLGALIGPQLLERSSFDVWFQADLARVVEGMTERWTSHARTSHHPLFALIGYPPTFALMRGLGLDPLLAIRLVVAAVGGTWAGILFLALRWMSLRRLDALVFVALGTLSASALCWFTVPETFPFGSLAIVFGAATVAAGSRRLPGSGWDVLASAAMLGTTKTNWAIGVLASLTRHGWRKAVQIGFNTFAVVVLLWSVQDWIFPETGWFLSRGRSEAGAILSPDSFGLLGVARSMFVHTIVFPAIAVIDFPNIGEWPLMLTQRARIGSAGWLGLSAALGWIVLLLAGVLTAVRSDRHRKLGLFLIASLGAQFALHVAFGDETFLYSAHFLPLLVLLAALAAQGPARRGVLALAVFVTASAAWNNVGQFRKAAAFQEDWSAYRHSLRDAMSERPDDLWQRDESSGMTATETLDGAWYGPGGSAYPVAGTFGVNLWVKDRETGEIIATSNDIPLSELVESPIGPIEAPRGWTSQTPWYQTRWEARGARDLVFRVSDLSAPVDLVIRGIAPRDPGPLRAARIVGDTLILNERWRLAPVEGRVLMGVEGPGWKTSANATQEAEDPGGWVWARIPLGEAGIELRLWDPEAGGPMGRVIDWIPARSGPGN